jgi:hypothetical protein
MKKRDDWIAIIFLVIVAALAYLPLVRKFGYYNDDWYLMYAAGAHGADVFRDIFSVDRPGRSLVMIPAYQLFGKHWLYYNLSAFVFRVLAALALRRTLNLLWPRQPLPTTAMALLFLIYPGFLSQPNAIDYQSHMVGLAAALLSVWFTLNAVLSEHRLQARLSHSASVLLGWLYLSQMEWYISIEFFRWACVFVFSSRLGGTFLEKVLRALKWAYASLAVPVFFLFWRLFFFTGERGATDVGLQLNLFRLYPLQTIYHWTAQVIQDLIDVMLAAWVIPLVQLSGYIRGWGIILGLVAAGGVALTFLIFAQDRKQDAAQRNVRREALWLGALTAVAGLIPIAMVNREVSFPSFSRYSLISSVGVAIFIVALLWTLRGEILRYSLIALLVLIAMLTHHANSVLFSQVTAVTQNFWWQVAWRVPQFAPRTTLVGNYPVGSIEEDYFIWGPANLIYYPKKQTTEGIQPGIFATVLNKESVRKILARERQEFDNRKNIITYKNYRNILILSQPSLSSCVHIIDGAQPEYSSHESEPIRTIGPFSEVDHVLADETSHIPAQIVFGPEPDHGWCYYYQKADLARQRGDWRMVLQLAEDANTKNLKPNDLIEWMPFLQAYALNGRAEELVDIFREVQTDEYISQQACRRLKSAETDAHTLSVISEFCVKFK